jgi:hypothetical protein
MDFIGTASWDRTRDPQIHNQKVALILHLGTLILLTLFYDVNRSLTRTVVTW